MGMASLFGQSERSGRLTRPVSDNTIAITRVARGEEIGGAKTLLIGTPPRRVGVAPPTVGPSNGRRPGNRAMGPTNQEASGREKKPLPPEKEGWWLSGRAGGGGLRPSALILLALISSRLAGADVVSSRLVSLALMSSRLVSSRWR